MKSSHEKTVLEIGVLVVIISLALVISMASELTALATGCAGGGYACGDACVASGCQSVNVTTQTVTTTTTATTNTFPATTTTLTTTPPTTTTIVSTGTCVHAGKGSYQCSKLDGSVPIGGSVSGCLNGNDWKYYEVTNSAGKRIKVDLTFSGDACNANDLYILSNTCSNLYYTKNNLLAETWEGSSSNGVIIGVDGDSTNTNCQWTLNVDPA